MKRALLLAVFAVSFLGSACTTTPTERREDVTQSLIDVKNSMVATRTQIDEALSSLNTLMNASRDDINEAYTRYADDVEKLQQSSQQVFENAEEMREQRDSWLSVWQESHEGLENEELKDISKERRSQIASRFDNISESFEAAREAFVPFLENLDDVKTVVGNDLTPAGITAVSDTDVVQEARANGSEAEENLETAIAEFDKLTRALGRPAD
jgi:hypothetical protein